MDLKEKKVYSDKWKALIEREVRARERLLEELYKEGDKQLSWKITLSIHLLFSFLYPVNSKVELDDEVYKEFGERKTGLLEGLYEEHDENFLIIRKEDEVIPILWENIIMIKYKHRNKEIHPIPGGSTSKTRYLHGKNRKVLTSEDLANMDCPFPPEPDNWEEQWQPRE